MRNECTLENEESEDPIHSRLCYNHSRNEGTGRHTAHALLTIEAHKQSTRQLRLALSFPTQPFLLRLAEHTKNLLRPRRRFGAETPNDQSRADRVRHLEILAQACMPPDSTHTRKSTDCNRDISREKTSKLFFRKSTTSFHFLRYLFQCADFSTRSQFTKSSLSHTNPYTHPPASHTAYSHHCPNRPTSSHAPPRNAA